MAEPSPAELVIRYLPVDSLTVYAQNARTHSPTQIAEIVSAIREFGWTNPILVDDAGQVIAGHGRLAAASEIGLERVPTICISGLTQVQQRALVLADNKIALNAGWDELLLSTELAALTASGFDVGMIGFTPDELQRMTGLPGGSSRGGGNLAEQFMIAPFSVLNARDGWWQDRKRAWLALGIRSELGRVGSDGSTPPHGPTVTQGPDGKLQYRGASRSTWSKAQKAAADRDGLTWQGRAAEFDGYRVKEGTREQTDTSGTSIFDPVLCEIAYRWFSPAAGAVLDPFAGGSVRGVVAAKLGRTYIGVDLSGRQLEANRQQAADILGAGDPTPTWIEGDSRELERLAGGAGQDIDLVFSCPPYADLEVYSDDPRDLSRMPAADFVTAYRQIIAAACARLRDDRFACFVVGEVRDRRGAYIDLIGETVQAFRDAGLSYYNEAILVTNAGSLPIRAGKQFSASRKLGKTHQNVLVFLKGNGKRAAAACGAIEIDPSLLEPTGSEPAEPDGPPR